jgi:hypothetical protein
MLNGAHNSTLVGLVTLERLEVQSLLGHDFLRLFNVLDEGQVAMDKFAECFLSDGSPPQSRPILRPMLSEWTLVLPSIIVSGTAISMKDEEVVFYSAVAKEDGCPPPKTLTDIGAFDCMEDQHDYLEKYFPPGVLDTDGGKALASRVAHWLHGRCVSNVCVMQEKR